MIPTRDFRLLQHAAGEAAYRASAARQKLREALATEAVAIERANLARDNVAVAAALESSTRAEEADTAARLAEAMSEADHD